MTDRIKGLTVVLAEDIRDDDCQLIIDAILMLRGVAAVETLVANPSDYIDRARIRRELMSKLMEVLT